MNLRLEKEEVCRHTEQAINYMELEEILLTRLNQDGDTVLVSTHDLDSAL